MARIGFNGFKSKSAKSIGKKNIADKYSTLDAAIKSILGNNNVQIFTTLIAQTIVMDASNNVSRWNPLNYSNVNCYLTKSGNTPTYDTQYKLGKYGAVRSVTNQGLVQNASEDSASFNKTFICYMRQNLRGPTNTTETLFSHFWNASPICATSRFNTNNGTNFTYYNYATSSAAVIKIAQANTFASVLLPVSSSVFRVFESNVLPNRTGSQSVYDSNKSLIAATTGYTGTSTSNNSSYTFTPTSMGLTTAEWDTHYTNGFPASKINLLTNANDSMFYTLIYVPASLTSVQIQETKLLLDKLYGA